jgi:hypothetical protein
MTTELPRSIGRNDLCWCGSGKKYKHCHLESDQAQQHEHRESAREETGEETHLHRCAHYHPQTHKIPAAERGDFVVTVRNLASAGEGAWLHIESPVDLGRDQTTVDAALQLLARNCVLADFRRDPDPDILEASQETLDGMVGRGVFHVLPSGSRLRRYGRTEIVADSNGDGYCAYVSGRGTMSGVVQVLLDASAIDAASLGVTGGLLARVWPIARVVREVVRNRLSLPEALGAHVAEMLAVLVDLVSQSADELDTNGLPTDVVRAQANLPYLVGLREAIPDPLGQLEGMGLEPGACGILVAHLESAAASPPWLLRLADLAGDDWDTPAGYAQWVERARAVPEVTGCLDGLTANTAPAPLGPVSDTGQDAAAHGTEPKALDVQPKTDETKPSRTAGIATSDAFSTLDAAAEQFEEQRLLLRDRLAQILDEKERVGRDRREVEARLQSLKEEDSILTTHQERAKSELDAQAESEAQARGEILLGILSLGATRLGEASTAWSQAIVAKEAPDQVRLARAERILREYEETERNGLLVRLPTGIRDNLTHEVEEAREVLRRALGGRDPLMLPAIVTASEDDTSLVLTLGLPVTGSDDLAPDALQTALAAAVADVIADVAKSMPQVEVGAVEHEPSAAGGSVLRVRFSGPPPVAAKDCAEYCAALLEDSGERSATLRAAGVYIRPRVIADLDAEEWHV